MNLEPSLDSLQRLFGGRYRIIALLGSGGFGRVYEAEQTATGQMVALKLLHLHPDLSFDEQRTRKARFVREVAVCARLNHPHIVRLLDGGVTAEGVPFTCFSLVPGCDLHTLLSKKGALLVEEGVRLMGQVLDGLASAHEAGVVHRDLKPANVMVSTSGAISYATILDFGIGALLEQSGSETSSRLTVQGGFIGTPTYSAPEQLRGAPPSPRSDLYAWGLLFLECLTGKPAVTGATSAEILSKQCSAEPIPIPSAFIGHPLGRLIAAVTLKDHEKRVITAREALSELGQIDVSGLRLASAQNVSTLEYVSGHGSREGERRQITVLVSDCEFDVEGRPLTLDELALANEWLELRYLALAGRFGARLAGKVGNRSLFLVGYPKCNENDAVRAAQMGLNILDLCGQVPERLRRGGISAALRIGLDTGLALMWPSVSQGGKLEVVAPPVETAGVLAHSAKPNQMLISESSAEIVKARFELRPQPTASETLGGTHAAAFSIDCPRPCATISPAIGSRLLARLVGREYELAQLRERWQQCLAGSGKGILVRGEAGVGKSRLAQELLLDASVGGNCIELICTSENQTRPFHPVIELLNHLVNPMGDAEPEGCLVRLEQVLRVHGIQLVSGMRLLAPLLSLDPKQGEPTIDVSPDRLREQTLETLVDLVLDLARNAPMLLLVEDVQWADASTVAFLDKLVGCASESSLLVVMTARSEFRSFPSAVWQLDLEPLTRTAVKAMLEQVLATPVTDSLVDEVTARTGGICLFVEELGNSIAASAARAGLAAGAAIEHLPEVLIPLRLRDLLTMRLDEVGSARAVAQLAAVIGREFSLALLASISPLSEEQLQSALKVLLKADLIRERRRATVCQYAFRHALIRDAAYDGLVTSSRQSAHANIADAMKRDAAVAQERPELISLHLSKAGQYASAIEYAILAAGAALARSANEEARSIALKAEEWLLEIVDVVERAKLELALNAIALPVLMACWRWTEGAVRQKAERSLELLRKAKASPEQARVLWALGMYYMVLADRDKCRAVAEQQLALAEQLSDEGMRAAALNSLSGTLLDEGRFGEALGVAESALGFFDPVRHANHGLTYGLHTGSFARAFRALALCHLGRFRASLVEAELAEQDASRAGHSASHVLAVFYRALLQTLLEDRARTDSLCEAGIQLAQKHGHRAQLGYFACLQAWSSGNLNAMRSSVGSMEQWGQGLGLPFYQSLLAEVEAENGHPELALDVIRRSIAQSRHTGNISYLAASLSSEAAYLLALEPHASDEAEVLLREAMVVAQSQSTLLQEMKVVSQLAKVLRTCGRDAQAIDLLRDCCQRVADEPSAPVIDRVRALLESYTTDGNQSVVSESSSHGTPFSALKQPSRLPRSDDSESEQRAGHEEDTATTVSPRQ